MSLDVSCWLQWCWFAFHSAKPRQKAVFNAKSYLFLSQSLSGLLFLFCLPSLAFSLVFSISCIFSLFLLSSLSLAHTHSHGQLRTAEFSTCVAGNPTGGCGVGGPVQHNHSHSIHWPLLHPAACKHNHIQLTIHSCIVITTGTCYHTTQTWQGKMTCVVL